MKKTRTIILGAGALSAVVAGIAVGSIAGTSVAAGAIDVVTPPASVEFPLNAAGQTYGSAAAVSDPANEPELIRVLASNGVEGYALKQDLDADMAANPHEALAASRSANPQRTVAVYAQDGITVIGEFVISPSEGSVSED